VNKSKILGTIVISVLAMLGLCLPVGGQDSSRAAFWKGELDVRQFNFSYAVGVHDKSQVVRSVGLWKTNYNLYQNAQGVAREDLAYVNRNRSLGGPLDVKLFNYSRGEGLIFDKGRPQAIGGSLTPPVRGKAIGERTILGFSCAGNEYRWKTSQGATVDLRSWKATDSTFLVPLLEVEFFSDDTGALLSLTVQVVSHLMPAPEIPQSFFQPPDGLRVVRVPMVR